MCGILGVSGKRVNDVSRAIGMLMHRGPDDEGVFVDTKAGIGLAHRRLSILDLSSFGHQPMTSPDNSVTIVYNGEIYNFQELRRELVDDGVRFAGNSDTEVLLYLYLKLGTEVLSRLNGIFAVGLWDARDGTLLLARDALGVKPLYYGTAGGRFVFSSELKALIELLPLSRELDLVGLHQYLSFLWSPGERTALKKVHKVLPGEAMIVRAGRIEKQWAWYQLPAFRESQKIADVSSAISETTDRLRSAVHRQMVADVPVGAFLSGGLDSSAVVAFAREADADINCFTIETEGGAEDGVYDDLPYARQVAAYLGVALEIVRIDSTRMANDLEAMVAQLDEPLADPAPLNVLYISRLAREQGIKVLLSGAGGDDLFSGYRRHRAVRAERYWDWLPLSVRKQFTQLAARLDQRDVAGRRLNKLLNGAALDGDARLVNYFKWASRDELMTLYSPAVKAELNDVVAEAPMLQFLEDLSNTVTSLDRLLALEQRFFLADHNLIYTDKMSMAAGVEVRVPFLDLELVEFASRIPADMKQRGSVGKWVLKKAMEPYLPRNVIYRPKTGFGAPLRRWMRVELRELLGDLLSEASLRRRGLFEPIAVQRLIAANDTGKVDASYTLLSLLCIEIWCRRFIDYQPAVQ